MLVMLTLLSNHLSSNCYLKLSIELKINTDKKSKQLEKIIALVFQYLNT